MRSTDPTVQQLIHGKPPLGYRGVERREIVAKATTHAGDRGLARKARAARVRRGFAGNGIDVSVLPHLTDQDLKDIGVLLGHRRKILAAVAELPGKSQSASSPRW